MDAKRAHAGRVRGRSSHLFRLSRWRLHLPCSVGLWALLCVQAPLHVPGLGAAELRLVEVETLPLAYPDFVEPVAVACGPLGQLYLCDLGRGSVLRLDGRGRIQFEFASPSTQPGLQPLDLEVTGFQVYVLDAVANALHRYSDRGSYLDVLQSFAVQERETPRAVAVDGAGRVLLAHPARHVVRLIVETQETETLVGGFGTRAGEFAGPLGVAFAPDGSFYVADTGNARIQRFSGVGNFERAFTAGLAEPRGLAVGPLDELYVADARGTVQVFTADSHVVLELPGRTPIDVAVNADTLWVLSREPKALVRLRVERGE